MKHTASAWLLAMAIVITACSAGQPPSTTAPQAAGPAPAASVLADPGPGPLPSATLVPATATAASTADVVTPTASPAGGQATAAVTASSPPVPAATFTPAAAPVTTWQWRLGGAADTEDARFTELGGLDVYQDRVYAADAYGGVYMYDLNGGAQGIISAGEIGYVIDVKVGPDGTVYIADAVLHQITVFSADHDLLGAFGISSPDGMESGPISPLSLAVGLDGEVFVLDASRDANGGTVMRVLVFSPTGDFLRAFPAEPGPDAVGMAVGPDGTLFIVNQQGYVAEVEPEAGRLIARLAQEALAVAWPQMISIDDAGNLYVTTQIPAAVAVLDSQGHRLIERIGEETVRTAEGWPAGEFLFPSGIAVTGDGRRVFVGDTYKRFSYLTAFGRP